MANLNVPYLTARPGRAGATRWFWQPAGKLRAAGWKLVRLPDAEAEAIALARELNDKVAAWRATGERWAPGAAPADKPARDVEGALRQCWTAARARAKRCNMAFDLTLEATLAMLTEQQGRCAVTGQAFEIVTVVGRRRPYAPSIDRRDSGMGYVPGNCRLVCACVNIAMNDWGQSLFLGMAARAVLHSQQAPS